ncbi:MAG: hypothetical protein HY300_11790 [Verrucomicrobia bacterium]|nr:hypothetical protein [Verrucomicrobiota bacterium]
MNQTRDIQLLRRIRVCTAFFIVALVLSGVTAIPLETELNFAASRASVSASSGAPGFDGWIHRVHDGLRETNARFPFLAYGTDWLAFGHIVIALAFVWVWREPVRNRWMFDFGLIACALVVPWALVFGGLRGIPIGWRLVDCSFGILGAAPLWFCRRWARELDSAPGSTSG